MSRIRVALANVRCPESLEDSVDIVLDAVKTAAESGAAIVCFPECVIPGYRWTKDSHAPEQQELEVAWRQVDRTAAAYGIAVILGTERRDGEASLITARVTNADGSLAGFQDKVQLDPSEEALFAAGAGRRLFHCGDMTFGVVICHEGWRYPETVRWAARNGAQVVFHPHFEIVEDPGFRPAGFADPRNSFHEKAALSRAAENTCYFATVNCALPGSTTTSALIDPQGQLISHQPHGEPGILLGDLDLSKATGLLAKRLKKHEYE